MFFLDVESTSIRLFPVFVRYKPHSLTYAPVYVPYPPTHHPRTPLFLALRDSNTARSLSSSLWRPPTWSSPESAATCQVEGQIVMFSNHLHRSFCFRSICWLFVDCRSLNSLIRLSSLHIFTCPQANQDTLNVLRSCFNDILVLLALKVFPFYLSRGILFSIYLLQVLNSPSINKSVFYSSTLYFRKWIFKDKALLIQFCIGQ